MAGRPACRKLLAICGSSREFWHVAASAWQNLRRQSRHDRRPGDLDRPRARRADAGRGLLQVPRPDVSDQLAATSFDRAPVLGRQVDRRECPCRVLLAQAREPGSLGDQCQRELPEAGIVSDQQDRADLSGERLEAREQLRFARAVERLVEPRLDSIAEPALDALERLTGSARGRAQNEIGPEASPFPGDAPRPSPLASPVLPAGARGRRASRPSSSTWRDAGGRRASSHHHLVGLRAWQTTARPVRWARASAARIAGRCRRLPPVAGRSKWRSAGRGR